MLYFNLSILLMLDYFVNVLQNSILLSLPPNNFQDRYDVLKKKSRIWKCN